LKDTTAQFDWYIAASVALDLKDTNCHFTRLRQSGKGAVHA
jgi:hypothetical protein